MSYPRTIPRDLFNEANFLKCMGMLYLQTEGFPESVIALKHHQSTPFALTQDMDGWLYSTSINVFIHGKYYNIKRPVNSREPYPIELVYDDEETRESIRIFNDKGTLTRSFLNLLEDPHYVWPQSQ